MTYRQLDYWARTGVLIPSVVEARGSGTRRLYSTSDVRKAIVIGRLLDAGISLQTVRSALSLLDEMDDGHWLYAGNRVGICTNEGLHEALTGGACVVIDLQGLWTTLQEVG